VPFALRRLRHFAARVRFDRLWLVLLVAVPVVAGLGIVAARWLAAETRWNEIQSRGTLVVGIDPGWQPFSFYGASSWEGLDADLMREAARRMGLAVQTNPVGYDSMYDAIHLRQVDVGVSAVVVDASRTADIAYSDLYFDAGVRLVARADASIRFAGDMAGRRVAVALGSDADRLARYWERRLPNMARVTVDGDDQALQAVQSREADAALVEALAAFRFAGVTKAVAAEQGYVDISLAPQPYVMAVRADNTRLLEELNRTLAGMRSDGTLDRLVERWVGGK
jgi:ABC-type amino acid transport substrate-binding protein